MGRGWVSVARVEEEGRMGERRGDPRFNKAKLQKSNMMFPHYVEGYVRGKREVGVMRGFG
jgi:hypothetical protein